MFDTSYMALHGSIRSVRMLLVPLCFCASVVRAQGTAAEKAWADSALVAISNDRARDNRETIATAARMCAVFKAADDRCSWAEAEALRSASFSLVGEPDSALSCAQRAHRSLSPACDSVIVMRTELAMALFEIQMRRFDRVDSICGRALDHWPKGTDEFAVRASLTMNKAIAQANMGDLDNAAMLFRKVLHIGEENNSVQDIDDALSNLGTVKYHQGDMDSAEFFFKKALQKDLETDNHYRAGRRFSNLTAVAEERNNFAQALAWYDSAAVYAMLANDLPLLVNIAYGKAWNYSMLGNFKAAYEASELHSRLNDSLITVEKVRSMSEMQQKYESEKKAREILGLKADNLTSELEKIRVKRTRNIYLSLGIGVLLLAGGLWSRLRYVHRSRAAIAHEKEISEELLHNILPEEVADEIKAKGFADVQQFDTATVLFSDFKGFTQMSELLTPSELVAEIDHCFKAFDHIMTEYRIEKIKTIGDAYMASGGLPDPAHGRPVEVVRAALHMQAFMAAYKQERIAQGRHYFEMRLGLHTGPVIAGIVGVKKYAYDIWGDTVNIASRMESSGEVGQVNISEGTYAVVKDVPDLHFVPRGEVEAKGKGLMKMYFVQADPTA